MKTNFFYLLLVFLSMQVNAQLTYPFCVATETPPTPTNYALRANTGSYNTAVGGFALSSANPSDVTGAPVSSLTGGYNCAFGGWALLQNTSGGGNNVMGYRAMMNNLTGSGNIVLGMDALRSSASGNHNIAIGGEALISNNPTTPESGFTLTGFNVAIGHRAGHNNVNGNNNVFLGSFAGELETGSNTLYVHNTNTTNPLIYGNFSTRNLKFNGNVEITGTGSGLRFTNLPSGTSTTTNNAGKVLSVNSLGNVILVNDATGTGTGTTITAGANIGVSGNPTTGYTISNTAGDATIYNIDGALKKDRTVDMNDKNLWFSTRHCTEDKGKIYIGNDPSFPDPFSIHDIQLYKLYVEGGILTEKVKVALRDSDDWADYVFSSGYKLMPIKEVDSFIRENKHLPGVASAETLACEGLDLAEMQSKQMEKIEELTLYIIEQDKAIDKQQKEIDELRALVGQLLKK